MSYILDALKKAEAEKRPQQGPDLGHVLSDSSSDNWPPARRPRPWGKYALLMALGGMGWVAWQALQTPLNKVSWPIQIQIGSASQNPRIGAQSTASSTQEQAATDARDIQAYAQRLKAAAQADEQNTSPSVPSAQEEPVLKPSSAADAANALATLKLEVVSYSKTPANRFAMISGDIVREGDVLPAGFQVAEIQANQVRLEKGTRSHQLYLD